MDATQICGLLDADLVGFIHNIIVLIKIAVPIILVVLGMLDLFKGITSSKEDEMKKGQQIFIKRLISGVLVFFVITIVQLVMGFISKDDNSFWACADQIMNGTAGMSYDNFNGVTDSSETGIQENSDSSFITGDDDVSCQSSDDYLEFKNCLAMNNNQYCSTFYQKVCTSKKYNPLWSTIPDYSIRALEEQGITCSGSSSKYSDLLSEQMYSCIVNSRSSDPSGSCLSLMSKYCHK